MAAALATIPKTAPFHEDEIDLLNRVVGPASPIQRAWLAGFLTGTTPISQPPQAANAARPAEPLSIVFASESGNCERLSGDLARAASTFCFSGTTLPRRQPPSAVISSLTLASLLRSATASAEKPPSETIRLSLDVVGK